MKANFVIFLCTLLIIIGCSSAKKPDHVLIDGKKFISVKSFGAKGDGFTDDVKAIQSAFNKCKNIYFPKGRYLLGHPQFHPRLNSFALYINPSSLVSNIHFEEGAELFVKDNFGKPGEKYTVILIYTEDKNIEQVVFDGISITSNKSLQNNFIGGIFAIESKGNIKKFKVSNAKIYNLPGPGLLTYALYSDFKNIYTENLGGHGISAINPYNRGQEHFLYVDGYTSINDLAYSMDFSGTMSDDRKTLLEGDVWTGKVKNVISKGSKYGIKTAGLWNLKMDSILIEGSTYNGFFLSMDAVGRTTEIDHLIVRNCGASGVFLNGKSNFIGKNILIENCTNGLYVNNTITKVNGLHIDGKERNSVGIRVEGNVDLNNFSVTGLGPDFDYPVWITGKNVTFRNGTIFNNVGPWSFLVAQDADNVVLDNIQIYDDRIEPKQLYGFMIAQKSGSLTIKNCNRNGKPPMIENRSGISIRSN